MTLMRIVSLIIATVGSLLLFSRALPGAEQPSLTNPLESLQFLIGEWQGDSVESQGNSVSALESPRAHREFQRMLNDRYIRIESHEMHISEPRQPTQPPHDTIGIVSFDTARQKLVLRQFHTDGSIIQYSTDPYVKGRKLIFLSEAVENMPPGFRARTTYDVIAPDELEEVVERGEPGAEFRVYSRSRVKRK